MVTIVVLILGDMWNFYRTSIPHFDVIVLFGWYIISAQFPVVVETQSRPPVVCRRCVYNATNNCVTTDKDESETCPANVYTCIIVTKMILDTNRKPARYVPVMIRSCSPVVEANTDDLVTVSTLIGGDYTMRNKGTACLNITMENPSVKGLDIDRRCICRGVSNLGMHDNCNANRTWDDVMEFYAVQRTAEGPPKVYYTPYTVAPGSNSLANLSQWSDASAGTLPPSTATYTAAQSTANSAPPTSTPSEDSQKGPNEKGGSNAGLIAGLVVGILILAGGVGGGLWYWFKVHKPKQRAKKAKARQAAQKGKN
ncbi:uncharacterized protein LOC129600815 [Paramacrobiotus metropolitanus]|uniref:uncharacterized protein LOC129600815 n=1 Tax=Paramacrobiotus metropolitanus TaxID=2943436 RepID=UPI0024460D60|nr:uncharacterized protein LOC129600815 [Paramacrobiotus metropolitanus]